MNPKTRVIVLILIMVLVVAFAEVITISILYNTSVNGTRERLQETVKSHARLVEAVARADQKHIRNNSISVREITLSQIREAHSHYEQFSKSGEFTLSNRVGDKIVFLMRHKHLNMNIPKPVSWNSNLAEPMRLALSGESGTIIGLDYKGVKVLAAFEPVSELDLGIVAKIDLSEIRKPFLMAALISGLGAVIMIFIGACCFIKITNPIIEKLKTKVTELNSELNELRGILPICSYCKKIRNDEGSWDQVEVYVKQRADVQFSHGICPDCFEEHFSDFGKEGDAFKDS